MIADDNFGERDDTYGGIGINQYPPRVCVDYLSHKWREDDIWSSWKVMKVMSKKKEFANGVRLENASWRTWAKQKYNLKTVNPEKLNWLKDSDVTWLYGPLHTAWSNHIVSSSKSSTTEDGLNLMPSSTKSCLKKKSIAEMLRPVLGGKYGSSSLVTSNSDSQLYKKDQDFEVDSDCETSSTCSSMSVPTTPTTESTKSTLFPNERRKIQFNDHVEQYMVVESDDEDNSSDDGIVMKRDCTTITKLAPTKLKEERLHNNEYSALYTNHGHGKRRAASSKSSASSSNSNTTPSASTSTSTASSASTSKSIPTSSSPPSWANDDDDDDDDDEIYLDILNFEDFNSTNPPSSAQPQSSKAKDIIPPYNATDDEHFPDDDDDIVDKAVNLVRWVLKARNLSLFY